MLPTKLQLIDMMLTGVENKSNRIQNDNLFLEFLNILELFSNFNLLIKIYIFIFIFSFLFKSNN